MQKLPAGIAARVELHGTAMGTASYVVALIEQKPGTAVDRDAIRRSIRRLYETRLFETIDVVWEPAQPQQANSGLVGGPEAGQINLIFETTPRYFCGSLSVDGLPKDGPRLNEMITSANLELGTHYSPERISQTLERMHRLLEEHGYYQAQLTYREFPVPALQQMNVKFHVVPGSLTHVGRVTLAGDSDVALDDIEDFADIRPGDKVRKARFNVLSNGCASASKRAGA